jgi:hypothetical protein
MTVGCGEVLTATGEGKAGGSGTGSGGEEPPPPDLPPDGNYGEAIIRIVDTANVDLLFVIDDSATMAEEQASLAQNATTFIQILDAAQVNYRIAFTTTDIGGVAFCGNSINEDGMFVASSCLERGDLAACDCLHETIEIVPTITEGDPELKPRPWLERSGEFTNVNIPMDEAMACFLPQSTKGCKFEAPLEGMYRALERSQDPDDPQFGFMRPHADLAIVLATDEVDCSYTTDEIFLTNDVFWQQGAPNSAICWNAGVSCQGNGPVYPSCWSDNKSKTGATGVPDNQAVIHPISRYIDQLAAIEAQKKMVSPFADVMLGAIVGVPPGYPQVPLVYQDTDDSQFMDAFGIGPGCTSQTAEAVPPVRILDVVAPFELPTASYLSVCGNDFGPLLSEVADSIDAVDDPPCMPLCVGDTDLGQSGLQPSCFLREKPPGENERSIPHCEPDGPGWKIPGGEVACFYELTGADITPQCMAEGANLEFAILRSQPIPDGTVITGECLLSDQPQIDCP